MTQSVVAQLAGAILGATIAVAIVTVRKMLRSPEE